MSYGQMRPVILYPTSGVHPDLIGAMLAGGPGGV
jgi:hypothetical protein